MKLKATMARGGDHRIFVGAGVPLIAQLLQFGIVLVGMGLVRIPIVSSFLIEVLSIYPDGGNAHYGLKYGGDWYDPLSLLDWAMHFLILIPGLEIVYWFYKNTLESNNHDQARSKQPDGKGTSRQDEDNTANFHTKSGQIEKEQTTYASEPQNNHDNCIRKPSCYRTFYFLFALGQIQAIITLIGHSLIGYNHELMKLIIDWEMFLMRIQVFCPAVLLLVEPTLMQQIAFGSAKSANWQQIAASRNLSLVISSILMAGIINATLRERLMIGQGVGIPLSTLSLVAVVTRVELSTVFKLAWSMLAIIPPFIPSSNTDYGHTMAATVLTCLLAAMAYGLMNYPPGLRN